jgi:hypothetical protein
MKSISSVLPFFPPSTLSECLTYARQKKKTFKQKPEHCEPSFGGKKCLCTIHIPLYFHLSSRAQEHSLVIRSLDIKHHVATQPKTLNIFPREEIQHGMVCNRPQWKKKIFRTRITLHAVI